MLFRVHMTVLIAIFATTTFAGPRFSGEKGARAHRTRLAAGGDHTCALLDDGTVKCWGNNLHGELGDGTRTPQSKPVFVTGLVSAVSIAAGRENSCAILTHGLVSCWGGGALGDDKPGSATRVTVHNLANVVSLAAGFSHICAARADGTVWCWGNNDVGQLGIGTMSSTPALLPVQVPGLTSVVSLAAGGSHTCALLADGSVRCWGEGTLGELGNGRQVSLATPAFTAPLSRTAIVGAVELSAGATSTCALLSDGDVSCWGENTNGELGTGTNTNSPFPVIVGLADPIAVALASGQHHACAIVADGGISCWGALGNGATTVPMPVGLSQLPLVEVTGGASHTCAMRVDGSIACFGADNLGQIGNGTVLLSGVTAGGVSGISGTFLGRGVSAGAEFTCARRGKGTAACWGAGGEGQLGNGLNFSSSVPVTVAVLNSVTAISAGSGLHACALDGAGQAQCWGDNFRGQLGNGGTTPSNQPAAVSSNFPFAAISAGDFHTCALVVGGTVSCWGAGDRGQLGNGSTADSHLPTPVVGLDNIVAISAGSAFTCALRVDGTVYCWGDNTNGELGAGINALQSLFPVQVAGLFGATSVAAGVSHACATAASGSIFCWGSNSRGQIGNNSTLTAALATQVQSISVPISVSAGAFFTCAMRVGGNAACWGANDNGELSALDTASHLTPTTVYTGTTGSTHVLTNVVEIAAGTGLHQLPGQPLPLALDFEHTCALLADGTIRCWGYNGQGDVGNGTTIDQPRPVLVSSFTANVDPTGKLRSSRIAEVTALVDCPADGEARLILTLTQGLVSGTGHAEAKCTGALVSVVMTIEAHGSSGWQPGVATAQVEAIIRNEDRSTDDTQWTRQVVLSFTN
jgi:alpha-tubulin suppressor-like RCC1 family protein